MTHSKERNFVCSECGERFRSKGQMELHATRRHNPDTRPRIPCEECGKLFRIQADLRNHLSRHVFVETNKNFPYAGTSLVWMQLHPQIFKKTDFAHTDFEQILFFTLIFCTKMSFIFSFLSTYDYMHPQF